MRIAFVTNFCPHYRVKTFEALAARHDVDYYFFSRGEEWYWQREHGVRSGNFSFEYLPGFRLGRTRVTPGLVSRLWRRDYDVIVKCINGRFALPATYATARALRKPFVLWTELWSPLQTLFHRLTFPATRRLLRAADSLVVPGQHAADFLVNSGVERRRIFVAPHSVDNDFYSRPIPDEEVAELRNVLGLRAEQKVILYLGRLEESKGLRYLIEAFASLGRDDAALVIAGTGSHREVLQALVRRLGLGSRACFTGYVQPEKTPAYYALADVAVLPSIATSAGREPWGLTVNEAMNQGVPVVATSSVGAAAGALLVDGQTGLVVREKDSAALGDALRRLLDGADLRRRMGEEARRRVLGWSNQSMVQGFCQAIDYALASRRGAVALAQVSSNRR